MGSFSGQARKVLTRESFFFVSGILFDEVFPLFTASSLSTGQGLSFQSADIAKALSFAGPTMLVSTLLYPKVQAKLGPLRTWRICALIMVVVYPVFSLLPVVGRQSHTLLWVILIFLIFLRYGLMIQALTSVNVLVSGSIALLRILLRICSRIASSTRFATTTIER